MRKFTIDIQDLPADGQDLYILVVEDEQFPYDVEESYFYDRDEALEDLKSVKSGCGKLYKFGESQEVTIDCEQIA